jgi:hypothetical protein
MFTASTKPTILRKNLPTGKVTVVIAVTEGFVTLHSKASATRWKTRRIPASFGQMFLAQYVQRLALLSPKAGAAYSIKQFVLNRLRDLWPMADGVHLSKCLRARGKQWGAS